MMTNKEILLNCILALQPKYFIICKKYNLCPELVIDTFSKFKDYNLAISLQKSDGTISRFLSELLPNRPKIASKIHSYILPIFELKYCSYCNKIHSIDNFRKNASKKDGLQTMCKTCHYTTTKKTQTARSSTYRCSKLQRTPSWANLTVIKEFYKNCPEGYHVDHIIPLQGEYVSGLHIETNLQYLPARENCSKRNKFEI